MGAGIKLTGFGYYFNLVVAGNTTWGRQLVSFHTKGQVYKLESEKYSMVADIGLEFVGIALE